MKAPYYIRRHALHYAIQQYDISKGKNPDIFWTTDEIIEVAEGYLKFLTEEDNEASE